MTATSHPPPPHRRRTGPLVAGIRAAVERHVGWTETAEIVAEELRLHMPTPDVLTPEQRLGSPDEYQGHTLYVEPDGSFSIVGLVWRAGQMTRIQTTSPGAPSVSSRASSTRSFSTPT